MRIAFAGTPEFSLPPLRALADSGHDVVGVLTQPDRPAGRGQQLRMSPVKTFALERGLAVAQPQTLRSEEGRADLLAWQPDLLVVVAYGLILPAAALAIPRLGCVNIHASLLPRWRGAAPIQRAILAGDAITGVTIMQMDAGLDTGPMLLAKPLPIGDATTCGELHDALALLGSRALMEALPAIESGGAVPRTQPETGVTYAAKISKAEAVIDWTRSATEISRLVRAFNPWPIAETRFGAEQLRLHRALAEQAGEPDAATGEATGAANKIAGTMPGKVLGLAADGALRIACGSGVLAVTAVQRQGRRVVSAREFANGSDVVGAQLG